MTPFQIILVLLVGCGFVFLAYWLLDDSDPKFRSKHKDELDLDVKALERKNRKAVKL